MLRASGNVWPLARSAYMGWVTWGSDTWLSSDSRSIALSPPTGERSSTLLPLATGERSSPPPSPPATPASPAAALPQRADALALAESIEASAVREGAGRRAVELHTLA